MAKRKIEFFRHGIDEECLVEFNRVAKSIFITTGPKTGQFEKAFAEYLDIEHAVGLMSCTHALHLAYLALGIGAGDKVIVPAFTFSATISAVIHSGAEPVFVDVDPHTGLLEPDAAEDAITPDTKAICPVHLYGVMAAMDGFSRIAEKHGLKLVEDAAHCIEGRGPGYRPGSMSDAAAFSFYATKNITSGEGGALATRHGHVAETASSLRYHGMSKSAHERYGGELPVYDVKHVGYKCNLTDLQAALLLPQLARIEKNHKRRAVIAGMYNDGLRDVDGISLPVIPENHKSAYHLYTIRVAPAEKRDEFVLSMIEAGVNCSINYRPLSQLTFFREKFGLRPEHHPNATAIGNSTVTLPLYPSLKDEEVEFVIEKAREAAGRILGS